MAEQREAHNPHPIRNHPAPHPGVELHRAYPIYLADGDTYGLLVEDHLDLHGFRTIRIRLADIDTWETFGINADPVRGPAATREALKLLGLQHARVWQYSLDNPVMLEVNLREFNRDRQIGRVFLLGNLPGGLPGDYIFDGKNHWTSIAVPLRAGGHEKVV